MFNFKEYNIADWFSFYRIAAAPFLLGLLWLDQRLIFAIFLLLSYSTDAVDGFLARRLKLSSERGARLDSLGDQITVLVGLLAIVVFEFEFIEKNYLPILIVLLMNIVQQIISFAKYRKFSAFHTLLAKAAAIVEAVFVIWLLFFGPVYWLFYVLVVIALLESLEETVLIFMYKNWVVEVKGIYWAYKDVRRL